jgi:hypothetical protein
VVAEDGDCVDTDPQVDPGHKDTKGGWSRDGVDNDCNRIIDGSSLPADREPAGQAHSGAFSPFFPRRHKAKSRPLD